MRLILDGGGAATQASSDCSGGNTVLVRELLSSQRKRALRIYVKNKSFKEAEMRWLMMVIISTMCAPTALGVVVVSSGNKPVQKWTNSLLAPVANHESRVLHRWINGAEDFRYAGNVNALNDFLVKFVEATTAEGKPAGEVVLCPSGGEDGNTLQQVPCEWSMEINEGIVTRVLREDRGSQLRPLHPTVTIKVADAETLSRLLIPAGLRVTGPKGLKSRYVNAIGSSDATVRGHAAIKLAKFDPHDATSMAVVAGLLEDHDDFARRLAASSLKEFGAMAKPVVPLLNRIAAGEGVTEGLKKSLTETIEVIGKSEVDADGVRRYREAMAAIEGYLEKRAD